MPIGTVGVEVFSDVGVVIGVLVGVIFVLSSGIFFIPIAITKKSHPGVTAMSALPDIASVIAITVQIPITHANV